MDYKELIERLRDDIFGNQDLNSQAATAIETLLAERDVAIGMLHGECNACKHSKGWHNKLKCHNCIYKTEKYPYKEKIPGEWDKWEWVGPIPTEATP